VPSPISVGGAGAADQHGAGREVLGAGEEPVVALHGLVDVVEALDLWELDRLAGLQAAQDQDGEGLVGVAAAQVDGAEHLADALELVGEGVGVVGVLDEVGGQEDAQGGAMLVSQPRRTRSSASRRWVAAAREAGSPGLVIRATAARRRATLSVSQEPLAARAA
jgi:hypothetical protein